MGWPFGALPPIGPPTAPALPPPPQKPSILDRLAARLFPTGAYSGLLDPSQQQDVQHQGLMQLGANLLQAGGRSPQQRGTLANIGTALGGVNVNDLAQRALQLQAYRSQQQEQQLLATVAARHPIAANATPAQTYNSLAAMITEMAAIPGGAAIAEKFAPVLAALKPVKPDQARWSFQTIHENGQDVLYRVNEDTGAKYRLGLAKEPPGRASQALLQGEESRAAAQRLLTAEATGHSIETASPGAAQPSTWAAVLGGLTQKLAGEAAGTGVKQAVRGDVTNQYQAAADRWVDAYMQLVPKSRQGSAALRDVVRRTYWGQEGDAPGNVQAKASARQSASAALARAVATGTPPALPGFEPEPTAP